MKFEYIGWNTSGSSDKIWGIISAGENVYTFWGRRGKKYQFKEDQFPKKKFSGWGGHRFGRAGMANVYTTGITTMEDAIVEKIKKGYMDYTGRTAELGNNFLSHFNEQLLLAKLTNTVRNKSNKLEQG